MLAGIAANTVFGDKSNGGRAPDFDEKVIAGQLQSAFEEYRPHAGGECSGNTDPQA